MKIKDNIKNVVPKNVLDNVRRIRSRRILKKLYLFDTERHIRYAYSLNENWTLNNLRAKITFHYHGIEKGLSNPNIRFGFGNNAFTQLFFSMDMFIKLGYSTEDKRFQQAISVIKQYVELHEKNNFKTEWVSLKLKEYLSYFKEEFSNTGGYGITALHDIPEYKKLDFKDLALSRYSIRDFGEQPVDDDKINEAIQIATKTPSVCNRQAYRVYRIKNKKILEAAYQMQGGLTTNGENLQEMLLVTTNREFMSGPDERNQTYIDGGMYLMSLVYALTYNQIASCVLNTDFNLQKEKDMRKLLKVSYAEDLIAFVAIGTFKEENKYAKSPRDSWEDITVIID